MSSNNPHPVDNYVGKRVRLKRSLLGMSQEELARNVGVTFQQVQKYENAANRISASKLFEISKALNEPMSFFFEEMLSDKNVAANTGLQEEAEKFDDHILDNKKAIDLLRAFSEVKDENLRNAIVKLVKSIAPSE